MNIINKIKEFLFGKSEIARENTLNKIDELKEEIKEKVIENIENSINTEKHEENNNANTFINLINKLGLENELSDDLKEKLNKGDITDEELKKYITMYKDNIISKIKNNENDNESLKEIEKNKIKENHIENKALHE